MQKTSKKLTYPAALGYLLFMDHFKTAVYIKAKYVFTVLALLVLLVPAGWFYAYVVTHRATPNMILAAVILIFVLTVVICHIIFGRYVYGRNDDHLHPVWRRRDSFCYHRDLERSKGNVSV
jgi:uncharacterized membrane protein